MEKPFAAYEGHEPYIFVCYAHEDSTSVYPEIEWLHEQGINVWYDEGISPGAEFPDELARAILGAALALFYVSPQSIASRHCRDEVYFALDNGTQVLALHLTETEMPPGIALTTGTTQALMRYELTQGDYRRQLLGSVSHLMATDGQTTLPAATQSEPSQTRRVLKPIATVSVVALLFALGYFGNVYLDQRERVAWAKEQAIPEIRAMIDERWRDYTEPYELALAVEQVIPEDAELKEIFDTTSLRLNISSEPPGAAVRVKNYADPDAPWQLLGTTPIAEQRLPVGILRWKLEKPGYTGVEAAHATWDLDPVGDKLLQPNHFHRRLDEAGNLPNGMVRVAGTATPLGTVPDFFVDRYEVTNREFQSFVDAGGYRNRELWQHEFAEDGGRLTWEQAMARFVDQSDRPGPSTWLGGTFPAEQADYPVSGVSWFEAAAYAEFVGKSLPSNTHWELARGGYSSMVQWPQLGGLAVIVPFSNFLKDGSVPVGSLRGLSSFGAYDIAGNVREWCFNQAGGARRLVRGGSYADPPYRYTEESHAPPMTRSGEYGFRTVHLPDTQPIPEEVFDPTTFAVIQQLDTEAVVTDEVFEFFRRQFDYDQQPLNPRVESRTEIAEEWVVERVVVDGAYGNEELIINLFLPRNVKPPYQTVVYFPGSGSLYRQSSENIADYYEYPTFLSFLVKTGRAVAYPVYKGTFERHDETLIPFHLGGSSLAHRNYLVQLVQDFRRTLDYLDERQDIDSDRYAYYGMSWGTILGIIIPAVEPRLKAAILLGGGLVTNEMPETNPVHYARRIQIPMLMLVGRYDSMFSFESAIEPLYRLFGTAPEDKVMKAYDTDHIPPKAEFVTEILKWLDRYLGPVGSY